MINRNLWGRAIFSEAVVLNRLIIGGVLFFSHVFMLQPKSNERVNLVADPPVSAKDLVNNTEIKV